MTELEKLVKDVADKAVDQISFSGKRPTPSVKESRRGNWGHAGRPGHRGGSSPRVVVETTTKEIAGFPGLLAKVQRIKKSLKKKLTF